VYSCSQRSGRSGSSSRVWNTARGELVRVGAVAALGLPNALGPLARDPAVQDAQVAEMPGEVGARLRAEACQRERKFPLLWEPKSPHPFLLMPSILHWKS
jgi:hypothetical protein